jgi:hypothetical protein
VPINNKVLNGRAKTLPGDGKVSKGSYGNDMNLLLLRHLYMHNWVKRREIWEAIGSERIAEEQGILERQQEADRVKDVEDTDVEKAAKFRVMCMNDAELMCADVTSSDCGIVRFDGQMQMFGATVCCLRLHTVLLFASHCMKFTFQIMSFA